MRQGQNQARGGLGPRKSTGRKSVGDTKRDTVPQAETHRPNVPRRKPVSTFSSPFFSVSLKFSIAPHPRNRVDQHYMGATRDHCFLARAAWYVCLARIPLHPPAMIDEVSILSSGSPGPRVISQVPRGGQPGLPFPPASPSLLDGNDMSGLLKHLSGCLFAWLHVTSLKDTCLLPWSMRTQCVFPFASKSARCSQIMRSEQQGQLLIMTTNFTS